MSLDATIWAWKAEVESSTQRLILLSLADRAGEDHKCYPSIMRMVKDTKMNRKTIIEPYRVCRRPLFLRECPDEKSKIHP